MPILDIELDNLSFRCQVFDNETLSNQLMEKGYHIYNDLNILKMLAKPNSTVVDLGANIGWYTIIFSQLVGDEGRVHAFEPSQDNFDMLQKNIALNNINNVDTHQYVVVDYDGKINFYLNPENYGDHSISEHTYQRCFVVDASYAKPIETPCIRLDTFFTMEEFSEVSLIKIDVQGSECRTLHSLEKHLQYHRPSILIEYSPAHIYQAKSSPFELFVFLDKYQYFPFQIIPSDFGSAQVVPISLSQLFKETQKSYNDFGGWIDLVLLPG